MLRPDLILEIAARQRRLFITSDDFLTINPYPEEASSFHPDAAIGEHCFDHHFSVLTLSSALLQNADSDSDFTVANAIVYYSFYSFFCCLCLPALLLSDDDDDASASAFLHLGRDFFTADMQHLTPWELLDSVKAASVVSGLKTMQVYS